MAGRAGYSLLAIRYQLLATSHHARANSLAGCSAGLVRGPMKRLPEFAVAIGQRRLGGALWVVAGSIISAGSLAAQALTPGTASCPVPPAVAQAPAPGQVSVAAAGGDVAGKSSASSASSTASAPPAPSRSATPAKPSASPYQQWSVQVASYETVEQAQTLQQSLCQRGFDARVVGASRPYSVRVGRFATSRDALVVARRLRSPGLTVFVTPEWR